MSNQFFTEFPVAEDFNRSELLEYVARWISGIQNSTLDVRKIISKSSEEESFDFSSEGGEALRFASVSNLQEKLDGIQYDIPDKNDRVWRTELVLSEGSDGKYISIRISCLAGNFSSDIRTPKRPVIIRQLVENAIGGRDKELFVSDCAHFLSDREHDKAIRAVMGQLSSALPVVYVSSKTDGSLPCDVDSLAFELGGLAHVLVEPDRSFSFVLKDATAGRNPYAGAIGIGFPGKPISLRVFPERTSSETTSKLVNIIKSTFLGRVASHGREWSDLQQAIIQENRLKLQEQARSGQSEDVNAWIESFEGELGEKDAKIQRLINENQSLNGQLAARFSESQLSVVFEKLRSEVGELYEGELLDRLRNCVGAGSSRGFSLSDRDRIVADGLFPMMQISSTSDQILSSLKPASDASMVDEVFTGVLSSLGYSRSEDGKHIKFTPPDGLRGIGVVTIAKTASDYRAGDNAIRDVRSALGLRFASE